MKRLTLDLDRCSMPTGWQNDEIHSLVDGTTWHELLRSFTGVNKLCTCDSLSEELSLALDVDEE